MPTINLPSIRNQVTNTLRYICGGVRTTLHHPPTLTDYPVYGVLDRIHQIASPTNSLERITTQLMFASADTTPDDLDLSVGPRWKYTDAQGKQWSIVAIRPTRPDGITTVAYEIELVR